jgi:hypothetical protein
MITNFDRMIGQLEEEIAGEEERTRIKDPRHPAYSMLAKAAAKRRQNLVISVAHIRSTFEVAKREFDQVTAELHELEPTHSRRVVASSSTISRLWWLRRIAPHASLSTSRMETRSRKRLIAQIATE